MAFSNHKDTRVNGKVDKSGDVMTGSLKLGSHDSTEDAQFRILRLGTDDKKYQIALYLSGGNAVRVDLIIDGKITNFMQLSATESAFSKPLRVSAGGTGVTSLADLKTALGITALENRVSALGG